MPDWWAKIKSLLSSSELSSPTQPAVHEIIKRSVSFEADYARWKDGPLHRRLLNWIAEQYTANQNDQQAIDPSIDFLHTPSTKGIAIHFADLGYSNAEARFLLDYFKEQIRAQDYRTQVSDTRTYSKNTWVETVERHYLKPRPQYDEAGKINQLFGNITVLLTFRDEQVYNLKLSATAYQDRLFNGEQQFSELMRKLTF